MKKLLLKIVGTEAVLNFLAGFVARVIESAGDNLDADNVLYGLGKKIRKEVPGDQVEAELGELLGSFKQGLLGKPFNHEEAKKEDGTGN